MSPASTWRAVQGAVSRSTRHLAVDRLMRAGFVGRGAVYAVIAALALALALGAGGETTDTRGALAALAATRVGRSLLLVLGLALAGLALFFVVEALAAPRHASSRAWGAAMRIGNAGAALGYGVLAVAAERLGNGGRPGPTGERQAEAWTQRALDLPGGRWLVLAAALVVIFVGGRQAWRGIRRRFLEDLATSRVPGPLRRWAAPLGTVGFTVQGAVFVLVGVFFADAALRDSPRTATGFDGALAVIAHQRWGPALLAAVALGLLAYAAYSVLEGHHRRLRR
jgi:hypothetical protein